jgi:hypothetical protein
LTSGAVTAGFIRSSNNSSVPNRKTAISTSVPGTAPNFPEKKRRFRITHPFHPWRAREFDLVEHRWVFTESVLYFHAPNGRFGQIPAVWTDFVEVDAFCAIASGRSRLHGDTLWLLAETIARLKNELAWV